SALTTKTTKTQPYPSTKLVLAHRVGATGEVAVLDKAVPWFGARNQGYTRVLRKGRFMPPDQSSFSVAIRHGRFFTLGRTVARPAEDRNARAWLHEFERTAARGEALPPARCNAMPRAAGPALRATGIPASHVAPATILASAFRLVASGRTKPARIRPNFSSRAASSAPAPPGVRNRSRSPIRSR